MKSGLNQDVRLTNAALDEADGKIILRGVIDCASLKSLLTDDYQREVLPLASLASLMEAYKAGSSVPDVDLGMRGGNFTDKNGIYILKDPVYIVDGLQRISAAIHAMTLDGGLNPRIGATIHFYTTSEQERERFRILNSQRSKVSPNVMLRNLRQKHPGVQAVYDMCEIDKTFALHNKVCWGQRMTRSEMITALTVMKTTGVLLGHIGPGKSNGVDELSRGMDAIFERTGKNIFRGNVRTFFDLVDQCWGIKSITFKEGATQLRTGFLYCLALILSNHHDFWRGEGDKTLLVEAPLFRKIKLFPVHDPEVARLASAGGKARELLYTLMLNHINSGKRTKRLRPRNGAPVIVDEVEGENASDE